MQTEDNKETKISETPVMDDWKMMVREVLQGWPDDKLEVCQSIFFSGAYCFSEYMRVKSMEDAPRAAELVQNAITEVHAYKEHALMESILHILKEVGVDNSTKH